MIIYIYIYNGNFEIVHCYILVPNYSVLVANLKLSSEQNSKVCSNHK